MSKTKKVLQNQTKKQNVDGKVSDLRINNQKSMKSGRLVIRTNLNQDENKNVFLKIRSCFVKLRRTNIDVRAQFKPVDNNLMDESLIKAGSTKKFERNENLEKKLKPRRVVKGKYEHMSVVNENKYQQHNEITKFLCGIAKRNEFGIQNIKFNSPITLKKRNFIIRLKKIENISSNVFSPIPIIDNIKRNNVRKLSLTKNPAENDTKKKVNNDKTKMDYEENENNNIKSSKANATCNEMKNLTKNDQLTTIKQTEKLTLKKYDLRRNKNKKACEDKKYEPEEKSSTERKQQENLNEKTTINSRSQDKYLSRNLANKSEEIENLLNSLDDEEEIFSTLQDAEDKNYCKNKDSNLDKSIAKENNAPIGTNNNKVKKFFHRKEDATKKKEFSTENTKAFQMGNVSKKRRFHTNRTTFKKQDNTYEFLSQSLTDSEIARHVDPSADIIKKLIEQGKVRLATNCKGKGKPKFKRQKVVKNRIKKNEANIKLKQLKNNAKKVTFIDENKGHEFEDCNIEDHFDDNTSDGPNFDKGIQKEDVGLITYSNQNHNDIASDREGTFSRLAKSVLLNQSARCNTNDINFISTPKNKKIPSPQTVLETDLSPILITPPAAKGSPWRVNESANLPTTFNFYRSSGNLPSFSSDILTAPPRKNRSTTYLNGSHKTSITERRSPTKSKRTLQLQKTDLSNPSEISSFSSNDSNAENIPPPKRICENRNENESIFDSKQLPNPRRAYNHRSPLKSINIIEVVHLPPYKHPNSGTISKKRNDKSVFEENLNDSLQGQRRVRIVSGNEISYTRSNTEFNPREDLFGFEDYLSQSEFSSQDNNDTTESGSNQTIHDKLKDLRKLKPAEFKVNSENPIPTVPLFDDYHTKVNDMRQRDIKEMLCSTMLDNQPSTSKEALKQVQFGNFRNTNRSKFGDDLDLIELFKDPDPETTFNENEAHRTYIRPQKRKRRLRENKYVVYLDSDESENEDHSHEEKEHQHSNPTNSSTEEAPKKKRHPKQSKETPELIEFIQEFNKLCEDVDSYNLIVE